MKYLEDHDAAPSMLCRVYLRYIEHIYYKVNTRTDFATAQEFW